MLMHAWNEHYRRDVRDGILQNSRKCDYHHHSIYFLSFIAPITLACRSAMRWLIDCVWIDRSVQLMLLYHTTVSIKEIAINIVFQEFSAPTDTQYRKVFPFPSTKCDKKHQLIVVALCLLLAPLTRNALDIMTVHNLFYEFYVMSCQT